MFWMYLVLYPEYKNLKLYVNFYQSIYLDLHFYLSKEWNFSTSVSSVIVQGVVGYITPQYKLLNILLLRYTFINSPTESENKITPGCNA